MRENFILRNPRLWPWLVGAVVGLAFCSNYLFMFAFRSVVQSHYPIPADRWANNGPFSTLAALGTDGMGDELLYASRAKESSERLLAFDPFIKENSSWRLFSMEFITHSIIGSIQAVVGNMSWTWMLTRFLCCVFWVVMIYRLALKMNAGSPFAIFCAVFITGFSYILTLQFVSAFIWQGGLLHILAHNAWALLSYGRTEGIMRLPRPGLIYGFSFLAALVCVKAAENRGWKWPIISGIVCGTLAYVRMDVWTTHLLAAYIFAAAYALKNHVWRKLFASAVLASIISLPYLYYNYPPEVEWMLRIGTMPGRNFNVASPPYLAACLLGLWFKRKPLDLLFASVAGAIFIMLNIELVTGYHSFTHPWKYLGCIYLFLQAVSLLPEKVKNLRMPWLAASAAGILTIFLQSVGYSAIHFPFSGIPRDYDSAFQWMRRNTPPDSVFFTLNPEINLLIPVFTENKLFLSYVCPNVSDFPLARNTDRFMAGMSFLGIDKTRFVEEVLFRDAADIHRGMFEEGVSRENIDTGVYSMLFMQTPAVIAREVLAKASDHADARPDYLWYGHFEKRHAAKDFPAGSSQRWQEVYRNPTVTLYRRDPIQLQSKVARRRRARDQDNLHE